MLTEVTVMHKFFNDADVPSHILFQRVAETDQKKLQSSIVLYTSQIYRCGHKRC